MTKRALAGRRWLVYFAGFFLGLTGMLLLLMAKQKLAPKFHDKNDERAVVLLAPGGSLRLRFLGEPERRLVHGFPSALYLAKEGEGGRWTPLLKLGYDQLLAKEQILGPWIEPGNYEVRLALYLCKFPGAQDCLRRLVVQPLRVGQGKSSAELTVDLDADLPDPQERPIP